MLTAPAISVLPTLFISIAAPGPCEPTFEREDAALIGPNVGEAGVPRNTWIWFRDGFNPFNATVLTDKESGESITVAIHRFEYTEGLFVALEPAALLEANRRYRFTIQFADFDFTTGAEIDDQGPPTPSVKSVRASEGTEACEIPKLTVELSELENGAIAVPNLTITAYDPPFKTLGKPGRGSPLFMDLPAREDDIEVTVVAYDLAGNASVESAPMTLDLSALDDGGACACVRARSAFDGLVALMFSAAAMLLARRRRS